MKKEVGAVSINGIVFVKGMQMYVIDKKDETESVLLQSLDGTKQLVVPRTMMVDVIVEPIIQRIRGFEPVSNNGIELTKKNFGDRDFVIPDRCIMPQKGTIGSSGYDLATPVPIHIPVGETFKFFTNLKAYMQPGEMLIIGVRSSTGIDDQIVLGETLTFIDQDYYNNSMNEGNFAIVLRNTGRKAVHYNVGDRICQAVFVPFLMSDNCNTDVVREGGLGSTGR